MVLFFVLPILGYSQYKPVDFGDVALVGKSKMHNETYYSFWEFKETPSHNLYSLFRYGLSNNFEVQIGWNGRQRGEDVKSIFDQRTTLGLKAYLVKENGWIPSLAAAVSTNLTLDFDNIQPSLTLFADKNIIKYLSFNGFYQYTNSSVLSSFNYSINLESPITNWLDFYVGYNSMGFYGDEGKKVDNKDQIELGMFIWVRSGLRIYPYYDFSLSDSYADVVNLGVLIGF